MALSSAPSAASAGRHARARKNASIRPRIDRSLPGYFEAQGRESASGSAQVLARFDARHDVIRARLATSGYDRPLNSCGHRPV